MYLIQSVKLLMKNQIYVKQIDCAKVDLLLGWWNYGKEFVVAPSKNRVTAMLASKNFGRATWADRPQSAVYMSRPNRMTISLTYRLQGRHQ